MTAIEARRFARHPAFLLGTAVALGLAAFAFFFGDTATVDGTTYPEAALSHPIIPAFFIGIPSLLVAARLVRSTEAADEVMGAAPGSEGRRTLAVAGACGVPFAAGLAWLALIVGLFAVRKPYAEELWFPTMDDLHVWSILVALGPVACLGGGLLGVLVGRWLRFRGAAVIAAVLVVAVCIVAQQPFMDSAESARWRVWLPWAMWHSGGSTDEAWGYVPAWTQVVHPGNPTTYLLYLLVLCGLATLGAVWHDRASRTPRLRLAILGLMALAVGLFVLSALTGLTEPLVSGSFASAS